MQEVWERVRNGVRRTGINTAVLTTEWHGERTWCHGSKIKEHQVCLDLSFLDRRKHERVIRSEKKPVGGNKELRELEKESRQQNACERVSQGGS